MTAQSTVLWYCFLLLYVEPDGKEGPPAHG